MRRSPDREIFKIMSPDNRARVFKTNPGPRHSRIAIGIDKIDLPAKKDVTVIRAARDQNQRADENDFRRECQPTPHAPLKYPRSAFRNSKFQRRRRSNDHPDGRARFCRAVESDRERFGLARLQPRARARAERTVAVTTVRFWPQNRT